MGWLIEIGIPDYDLVEILNPRSFSETALNIQGMCSTRNGCLLNRRVERKGLSSAAPTGNTAPDGGAAVVTRDDVESLG